MSDVPLSFLRSRGAGALLVSVLLVASGILTGCSPSNQSESNSRAQEKREDHRELNRLVDNLHEPLERIQEKYPVVAGNGETSDTDYREVQSLTREARRTWTDASKTLLKHLPADQINRTDDMLRELVTLVESKGDTGAQKKLVSGLLDTVERLRTKALPDYRRGTVRSIRQADRDITAEKTVRQYRIGVTLPGSRAIYDDTDPVSPADQSSRQLRVLLREKRTKRFLPGADVTARLLDSNGNEIRSLDLLETWGPYHFYGRNLDVPSDAVEVSVHVEPPRVGRHADMKEQYIKTADVQFPIDSDTDDVRLQGAKPTPVSDDVVLGSNIETALRETLETKSKSPYQIGFIAEHAEPFWIFDTYKTSDDNTSFNVRLADIPQSANRHLEIVLFDEKTYRSIPNANVTLHVRSTTKETQTRLHLPYLLSAFYHYGNSIYLPNDEYIVEATIWDPTIHTLRRDSFPYKQTATFKWSPATGESTEHTDRHS